MRRLRSILPFSVLAVALLAAGFKTVNYLDGAAVMGKVHETHGTTAEVDVVKMDIYTKDAPDPQSCTLLSAVQNDGKGGLMYFMRVLAPESQKGLTFLVLEDANDNVEQYLITVMGTKKIAPSERSAHFMGSDFTYEDLRREKPGEWTYDRLDDEKIRGTDCYAIMATPANKDREQITGYTYRFLDVDKTTYDIRHIDFLDSKQKPLKSFDAFDYQATNTSTQRPRSGIMVNLVSGTKTVMTLVGSRLDKPLDPKFFTLETLKSWGLEQDQAFADLLPKAAAPAATPAKTP